jgi:hypothetical protein
MAEPNALLWRSISFDALWFAAIGCFYWLIVEYGAPEFVPFITLVVAIGSGLLLMIKFRILVAWVDRAKQDQRVNFLATVISLVTLFALTITMWAFYFLFLSQIAHNPTDTPFCSGTVAIDPGKFGLLDAVYFTVTSFATVGYGDIYACSSLSRGAVIAELTTTITIGIITLSALTGVLIEFGRTALGQTKTDATDTSSVRAATRGMVLIAAVEPAVYAFLTSAFPGNAVQVRAYNLISVVLLIPMGVSALVIGSRRMLGRGGPSSINLVSAIRLVLLAYVLFVEGFAYLFLTIDVQGAFAFAKQGEEALSFLDAIYFSISTLSTAGFGDITPVAPMARMAATGEILVGMVFGLFAFSLVISALVNQRLLPVPSEPARAVLPPVPRKRQPKGRRRR